MNADGTLRQTYEPRGLVVASGEDIPKGHSLRARMIVGHIEKGAIDKAKLSCSGTPAMAYSPRRWPDMFDGSPRKPPKHLVRSRRSGQ